VALIVLKTMVGLAIVTIASVAPMIVVIFVATMLLVAQFTATGGKNMSRCLLFWLLLVLGNLLVNTSHLVGCLTLLKESNKLEQVSRHHLVQVRELKLMHLGLRGEDLFTLILHRGYFHYWTEVAILKIAEKLYSTPHELVHWHESGLLGRTKPANQLVAYIGKTGDLEVILVHSSKFAFVQSASFGHCFAMMLVHLVRPMS
jgi:hypothetical protein